LVTSSYDSLGVPISVLLLIALGPAEFVHSLKANLKRRKKMNKRVLLLSTAGIAAGLLYAFGVHGRKDATADEQSRDLKSSGNERSSVADRVNANGSPRQREGAASTGRIEAGNAILTGSQAEPVIDDQGTDQFQASQILKNIRDSAFDASDEKLALALGRPTEEIEEWTSGAGLIDGDVIMKARALALQRGLQVE
jgi:hypothetical protein